MRVSVAVVLIAPVLAVPGVARADTHTLSIHNGSGEAVVGVYMSVPGSGSIGANRLRSQLPPGAEGPFTYSTGCRVDVRLAYAGGRSEDHADVDVCGGARVVAGQSGVAGPAMPGAGAAPRVQNGGGPDAKGGKKAAGLVTPVTAPPPIVPPWTGKSITKRFGGME